MLIPLAAVVGRPGLRPRPAAGPLGEPGRRAAARPPAQPRPARRLPDHQQRLRHAARARLLHRGDAARADLALRPDQGAGRAELLSSPNTITLRLATVFGMSPRMRLDLLVNHFVYAAVTDGYLVVFEKDFKRNFVHVRDVADCFLHCIDHAERMVGRTYNVGLDEANLSKEELALEIKQHVPGFYVHFAPIGSDPDKRNYVVSNQRLRRPGSRRAVAGRRDPRAAQGLPDDGPPAVPQRLVGEPSASTERNAQRPSRRPRARKAARKAGSIVRAKSPLRHQLRRRRH